jgi:hypothetical protein
MERLVSEMDAMMADGLLSTVRELANEMFGGNKTYPCDDVKCLASEIVRLRRLYEAKSLECARLQKRVEELEGRG